MNKFTFPLTMQMRGQQVTDLQDPLQRLLDHGAPLADDEVARRELSGVRRREITA